MGVVEVLDAVQPARAGGWKVDVSRGDRNGRVSSEWFNRPDDERYLSLDDLWANVKGRSERSRSRVVQTADIRVEAARGHAPAGVVVESPPDGEPALGRGIGRIARGHRPVERARFGRRADHDELLTVQLLANGFGFLTAFQVGRLKLRPLRLEGREVRLGRAERLGLRQRQLSLLFLLLSKGQYTFFLLLFYLKQVLP